MRSQTSLIQTIGRAARNVDGKVIMYADKITGSIRTAQEETERRRNKQMAYNKENGITPESIRKNISDVLEGIYGGSVDMERVTAKLDVSPKFGNNLQTHIENLQKEMFLAAENLEFEQAASLRDEINELEKAELAIGENPLIRQSELNQQRKTEKLKSRSKGGVAGTRTVRSKAQKR